MRKYILLITVMSLFVSCKSDKEKPLVNNAPKKFIVVEAGDNIKFNMTEIRVKSGDRVVLTLKHVGKMLKMSMGHNLVILKKGTDMEKFANAAITAATSDYIPNEGKEVIAYTKMLGGGESDTIAFDAPEKGTYDFLCSFPGHWGTMKGKFIVE